MTKKLTQTELEDLVSGMTPKVARALVYRRCHDSYEAFCRLAWPGIYPQEPFPTAPYVRAMICEVQQLVIGEQKRLCNNIPPRCGKTVLGSILYAAWILGRDPTAKVFIVSYGLELSESLTARVREVMTHDLYRRIFPATRLKVGANRKDHFHTTVGGECMAASQSSSITGFGTHYMIIDDFQKADEALSPVERENAISTFRNTLLSRFDNLGDGRILINQQRLHEEDLSGFAIGLGWPQFKLPAIATENAQYRLLDGSIWHRKKGDLLDPVRLPKMWLDEQRLAQGNKFFEAQYQQNPGVAENCIVNLNWFGQYDKPPERKKLIYLVQSWDPAISPEVTADYSVGMTWGFDGKNWLLLDLLRIRVTSGELIDRICAWHKHWKADGLIIEGGSIGDMIWDEVRVKRQLPGLIIAPRPKGSKIERMSARTAMLEQGRFHLPASAPWLEDLRKELLAFPDWKHDDQVDALSQFLAFVFRMGHDVEIPRDEHGRRLRRPNRSRRPRRYERKDRPDDRDD